MYGFEIRETQAGSFELDVAVPREPKVIWGVPFNSKPLTLTFSETAVLAGKFGNLVFDDNVERNKFTKAAGERILAAKGAKPVAVHS